MSETCIMFGELGARVIVEDKQVQHYAIHVDPIKKEVSCWIASEAGKVSKSLDILLFHIDIYFFSTNLGIFGCLVGT